MNENLILTSRLGMTRTQSSVEHWRSVEPGVRPSCPRAALRQGSSSDSGIFCEDAWHELGAALGISRRELQVVRLIFDDEKECSIAADLGISVHTVHTYIERLHRKLDVRDRVQLVLRITQEFLDLARQPASGIPPICPLLTAEGCPFKV
jgi:DNA-binding CsgD family transcriptional regulator